MVSGSDGKALGTAATPTPVTGSAAEPETQPMPVSVTSTDKKKWTGKSTHLVNRDKLGRKGRRRRTEGNHQSIPITE